MNPFTASLVLLCAIAFAQNAGPEAATPQRLYNAAWAHERLGFDYDRAIALYTRLCRRGDAPLRLRTRALLRVVELERLRAGLPRTLPLLKELEKDGSLPPQIRRQISRLRALIARHGRSIAKLFAEQRSRFARDRARAEHALSSPERERLRREFLRRLEAATRGLSELLRPTPRRSRGGRSLVVGEGALDRSLEQQRRKLWRELITSSRRLHELRTAGAEGSAELARVEREHRALEERYRKLLLRMRPEPRQRRRLRQLRRLRVEIDRLDRSGDFERADRLIDEALKLDPAPRGAPGVIASLRDPVRRRPMVERLRSALDKVRRREGLAAEQPARTRALAELASQLDRLAAQKRWREAAETVLRFLSEQPWARRLLQKTDHPAARR